MLREMFGRLAKGRWEIATADNHAAALAQIERSRPDVAVLDVNMPVMDGLQFLRLLRRTHPALQVVMLTSRGDEQTRQACLDSGAVMFLQKVIAPKGFQAVFAALDTMAESGPPSGFRGLMRQVGLPEVLQMECLGRKSSVLEVFANRSRGRIFIQDGSIVHAEFASLEGEAALYGLLALRGGEFNLHAFTPPERISIQGHYEFLLMEAARLRDEGAQFDGAEPPAEAASAPAPAPLEALPAEPPRIEEVLLCSGSGEVLHYHGGESADPALSLLSQVEQQALQLSGLAPLGRFDRFEVVLKSGRIVCLVQPHLRLVARSTRTSPGA